VDSTLKRIIYRGRKAGQLKVSSPSFSPARDDVMNNKHQQLTYM
jgi:hypothetical protein